MTLTEFIVMVIIAALAQFTVGRIQREPEILAMLDQPCADIEQKVH